MWLTIANVRVCAHSMQVTYKWYAVMYTFMVFIGFVLEWVISVRVCVDLNLRFPPTDE